jgi:hypothetical protein
MRLERPLPAIVLLSVALAAGAGSASAQDAAAVFSLPPLEEFGAIVDRPLFSPDRRPPADQVESEAPVASSEPSGSAERQIVLAGTATDQSERAVAILHDLSQGIQFRVWVGDEIEGWTVKAIEPRAVVLSTATQEVTVTLDEPAVPVLP